MDWFKLFYTVLGGLGLFFFGMTKLSDSLQVLSGNLIKKIINILTTNRFIAVLVGMGITMIVQSSSITTVMVVSFVNAGLMNLTQAIGVIFGANIGTTITGWIIAINLGKYGLALIGFGVIPMLFIKKDRLKNVGTLIFGLGLVFFGLDLMSSAFKPLRSNEAFLSMLSHFSADTLISILACIIIGTMLTMIIQSSSAMLGITIALASTGAISFQTSVALILGENIGTTITAFLASLTGNVSSKRAARAHTIFNVLGVIIATLFFKHYINLIESIIRGSADTIDILGNKPYIAAHIAAAHTFFNVSATILFLPFINHLAKFVTLITPGKKVKEDKKLKFLGSDTIPELAIEEAQLEVKKMSQLTRKAILLTKDFLLSNLAEKEIADKIKKYESITDNMQKEVFLFLNKVLKTNLTDNQTQEASCLIRASDELESIVDYCNSLTIYKKRILDKNETFSVTKFDLLTKFLDDTINFYDYTVRLLHNPSSFSINDCLSYYSKLNSKADKIREEHLKTSCDESENPLISLTFSDIIVALRRIKNHSLNLAQTLSGGKVYY